MHFISISITQIIIIIMLGLNYNNRKIIATYLLSEYFNIKRNKIHPVLFPTTACF